MSGRAGSKRRLGAPLSGLLGAAAVVQCAPASASHVPAVCELLSLRRRLAPGPAVALTFDDGPHAEGTAQVLALLERHGARATFFLVGEQVRRLPSLAREIADAGHGIGLHGNTHRCELRLTPAALAEDRARGLEAIHAATGVVPSIHRPPYGAASGPGIVLARRAGLQTILWSRWGRDWRAAATAESVVGDVTRRGPLERDIVLLHDADHYAAPGSFRATVGALPRILERCAEQRLATVAL
ncbi:MAG TPA: polysaccharide deacetylase family protein [Solirubrobacteraceae bacterium]|nr:polysaccharide deacetylase family protein [Solirubrobacteraceae bacterium]